MSSPTTSDTQHAQETLSPTARQLFDVYPELAKAKQPEWLEILNNGKLVEFPSKSMLMTAGSACDSFLLMLQGTLRIFQIAEDGREVTLYRTNPGHICMMSLNSLINNKPFKAYAKTETAVSALMLSANEFHSAMQITEQFRTLVLANMMNSVCEMIHTFYNTAFETLDMRLACLLGRLFERTGSDTLNITHQELAQELGTSREVVSRLLKKLENKQCITLSRGQIRMGENKSFTGNGLL